MTRGRILNRTEFAEVAGCSLPTVTAWIRRGMPTLGRDPKTRQWRIDSADALDWVAAQAPEPPDPAALVLDEQRARESSERADKLALENDLSRRELIATDEVERLWSVLRRNARARLMAVVDQAEEAGVLAMDPEQRAGLVAMIEEALGELAGSGVPDSGDAPEPA